MNGAFRAKGVQTVKYEVPTTILASATPVVVAAVVPEVPTSVPLEVKAPLEVLETAPESGLVPEDPPTE
jgi:hypothetical protein